MYTIKGIAGSRDLTLEHGLSELEDWFVRINKKKLSRKRPLNNEEHFMLCTFVAAMHSRTKAIRNHWGSFWSNVREDMEKMIKIHKTANPEELRRIRIERPMGSGKGIGYKEVKAVSENPLQHMMLSAIQVETPILTKLDLVIFQASGLATFITSDAPCVWYDPDGYKKPPLFRSPSFSDPKLEITLPISPRQLLLLNRQGVSGYIDIPLDVVDVYNRRTRFCADEYFISKKNEKKEIWFDPGAIPDDAWDKIHAMDRVLERPEDQS